MKENTLRSTFAPTDTGPATLPPHPDGGEWQFVMFHNRQGPGRHQSDDVITVADSYTDLLAALIPGYGDIPDTAAGHDEALGRRYDHAVTVASHLQGAFTATAVTGGRFDPATAGEHVLTALFSDRAEPFTGIPSDGEMGLEWTAEVPLVLVDTDYEPFTDRPAPTGRVVFLRPAVESGYVGNLVELGLIELLQTTG